MNDLIQNDDLYLKIKNILQSARDNAYRHINFVMVEAYWNIGKQIVEDEQRGKDRAEYGSYLIKELSSRLTKDFGKGFTQQNLRNMRQFYNCFPIRSTLCSELSWSHYRLIMRVDNQQARLWYTEESAKANWSVRALERQIGTLYYERIISSKEKQSVVAEATNNTKDLLLTPKDIIKDPYILEFLDLKQNNAFYESDLESALIEKIQEFLLELGRGFAFVARQKRIKTETSDFYIDLVFYNYILKCFVIIDLKSGKLTHQDVGQMDMYVRMYNDLEKAENDNPTIGIILCTDKDNTVVKYSVLNENENLFVSKYQLYLPTEEELRAEIERDVLELGLRREVIDEN
ncbi:PDDEXK nuclease domain-containing protein [Sulfuricurvum sp.]|uniref:PDDEXK nuclease domain-containing protein n=1 Tax=Sulfuricurvum sp. TaxID=2025608 RepID=UPI002611ECAD|nr:PDDEXK nuclease domain-containing protein [Sulfuricurvum sp.]MDD2781059.1 PDDEXK nuclease domain-containing protein [Sulfuricurvum sp.]